MSVYSWDSVFSGRRAGAQWQEDCQGRDIVTRMSALLTPCFRADSLMKRLMEGKVPQIPFYSIDIGTEKWAILGVSWYFILKHAWFYSRYLCRLHLLGLEYFYSKWILNVHLAIFCEKLQKKKKCFFFRETMCFKNHLASDYLSDLVRNVKAWV